MLMTLVYIFVFVKLLYEQMYICLDSVRSLSGLRHLDDDDALRMRMLDDDDRYAVRTYISRLTRFHYWFSCVLDIA